MSVRKFLETNKVFFETVAALLLSLMAILVSIAQSCTAANQTKLLDRQTRVAESQVVPQLNVHVELIYDEATETYPHEALIVDNDGGFARHWSIDAAVFVHVVCRSKPSPAVTIHSMDVPINGYYSVGFVSSAQKGQLYKLQGFGNNAKFADLNDSLANSPACDFAFADLKRYVKVSYEDVLGVRRTQFFLAAPVTGMSELSPEEGELAFEKWNASLANGARLEYSKVTPQLLLSQLGGRKATAPNAAAAADQKAPLSGR